MCVKGRSYVGKVKNSWVNSQWIRVELKLKLFLETFCLELKIPKYFYEVGKLC
jgi:hypothetical protein